MQATSQKRENTRTTILALLLARKGGCTLQQLERDYYELEGERIPWKDLGYISLLSFLHSMSKSVQIETKNSTIIIKGIASEKSKHVSKLVAEQKCQKQPVGRKIHRPSHYYPNTVPFRIRIPAEILGRIVSLVDQHPDGVNKDYLLQQVQSCMPFTNISIKDMEEQLRELPHKIYQTNNMVYPIRYKENKFDHPKKSNEYISHKGEVWKPPTVTVAGNEDFDNALDYDEDDIFDFMPSNDALQSLSTNSSTKTRLTSTFIKETVSKCQDHALENLTVTQEKGLIDISNNSNNNQMRFHKSTMNKTESSLYNKDVEILINERFKFRLEKLIQNHPHGIWCAELPQKYLEEYKVPMNYAELGFSSVREFTAHLPEIFHCVQPHESGDFMLYYAKQDIPSSKVNDSRKITNLTDLYQIYNMNQEDALPVAVSLDTCKELIPDEAITIGECVGCLSVVDLMQNEEPYVEVVVVEVFTPSFFWVQLRKKQKIFQKFMDDLHNFYAANSGLYVIPPVVLEKGLNCVCMYNRIWHRGIIKAVNPDLRVTVMFYDYGTLKTYPPDAVYYLHRSFSHLPAQAIPCGLINVRPCRGSKWSRNATHHFAVRTSEIPLIATIASINAEDNSMMVTLTDTIEEEDVHINDWLVEQKYAEHGKMVDKVDMSNLLIYVEENLLFLPEECYEEESSTSDSASFTNVPLISPQSTLQQIPPKPSVPIMLPDEQENCLNQEDHRRAATRDKSIAYPYPKNNTNPFLEDQPAFNEMKSDVNPEKFMQLWHENLQLQMQITETLNILLNKVLKDSANNSSDGSKTDEYVLKLIEALSLSNKRVPLTFPLMNDNRPTSSTTSNYNNNLDFSTQNNFVNGIGTNACINQQQLPATCYAKGQDLSSCTNPFQNVDMQPLNGNVTSMNMNSPPMSMGSNFDSMNGSLQGQQMSDYQTTPADCATSDNTALNETNPFRLSMAGKLQIPSGDYNNWLHTEDSSPSINDRESAVEQDLISFENGDQKVKHTIDKSIFNDVEPTSYNHCQYLVTDPSSNTDRARRDTFLLNESSLNCNCNADGASNAIVHDQRVQHIINETQKRYPLSSKESFTDQTSELVEKTSKDKRIDGRNILSNCNSSSSVWYSDFARIPREVFKCETANENFTLNPNYDSSNNGSLLLSCTNGMESPTSGNRLSIDEGYSTRSSSKTSHTMCSTSAVAQLTDESPCNEKLMLKDLHKRNNVCADMWAGSHGEDRLKECNNVYGTSNGNGEQVASDNELQSNDERNAAVGDMLDTYLSMANFVTKYLCPGGCELGAASAETSVKSRCSPSRGKIFFQIVELPKRILHVFHYQDQGWLLVDEFEKAYTKFGTAAYMTDLLLVIDLHAKVEEIDRTKFSIESVQSTRILPKPTQDMIHGNNKLYLIPLKAAFCVLEQSGIVSRKDINKALKHERYANGSTAHEIWLISKAYKELKYHVVCGH